jgi:chromosome segregation ATPase
MCFSIPVHAPPGSISERASDRDACAVDAIEEDASVDRNLSSPPRRPLQQQPISDDVARLWRTIADLEAEVASYQQQAGSRDDALQNLSAEAERREEVLRALNTELDQHRKHLTDANAAVQSMQSVIDRLGKELSVTRAASAQFEATVEALQNDVAQFRTLGKTPPAVAQEIDALRQALLNSEGWVLALRNSWSWRITSPLRTAYALLFGSRRH